MSDPQNLAYLDLPEYNPGTAPSSASWNQEYGDQSTPDYTKAKPAGILSRLAQIAAGIAVGGSVLTLVVNAFTSAPTIRGATLNYADGTLTYSFEAVFEKDGQITIGVLAEGITQKKVYAYAANEANLDSGDLHHVFPQGSFVCSLPYTFTVTFGNTYFTRTLYSQKS